MLRLKVAAAEPASLVRLVPGAEVAVAPRPRVARQAHRAGPLVPAAAHGEDPESEELPEIWLRVQVRDPSAVSKHVLAVWDISRSKEATIMGLGSSGASSGHHEFNDQARAETNLLQQRQIWDICAPIL